MKEKSEAYKAGYDAGLNGPNTTNCHFSFFSTKDSMKQWEQGNKVGDFDRRTKPDNQRNGRYKIET